VPGTCQVPGAPGEDLHDRPAVGLRSAV